MSASALAAVPPGNRLLAALPPAEYRRLLPHLESVSLVSEAILHEPGQPIRDVYFPGSAVVSLLTPPGTSIEVGLVGREGMAGLPVFLGAESAPTRCLVQVPGEALRMRAEVFRSQVGRHSPLHGLLLRYANAFLVQVSQSVACNSLHPVEKRCCRWLLMTHGRVEGDRFPLTHKFLAGMLGVRRASVSEVARLLQRQGLIRYSRGRVTILDRQGLEATACECYRIVQAEFDRFLDSPPR